MNAAVQEKFAGHGRHPVDGRDAPQARHQQRAHGDAIVHGRGGEAFGDVEGLGPGVICSLLEGRASLTDQQRLTAAEVPQE